MNIIMIPIEKIYPNPLNPRVDLGDLTELADSIRENGIRQNLTVVEGHTMTDEEWRSWLERRDKGEIKPEQDDEMLYRYDPTGYTVIIGHRRLAASKIAGLTELPCVVAKMDAKEQQATMILENMQRNDLTVYEQARGFQLMLDLGSTIEEISQKTGFSRETVRKRVKLTELDQKLLKEVSGRQITLGDLEALNSIEDLETRNKCLSNIGTNNFDIELRSAKRKQAIKKNLPEIKAILKGSTLKAIKEGEHYSGKYDQIYGNSIDIEEFKPGREIIPKDPEVKFYYLDVKFGRVNFYKEHKRAQPVRKSKEELEKAKQLSEAWQLTDQLTRSTQLLREEFMKKVSVNGKTLSLLTMMIIYGMCVSTIEYKGLRDSVEKAIGLSDDTEVNYMNRGEKTIERLDAMPSSEIPRMAYAAFCDDGKLNTYVNTYRSQWPEHKKCKVLDMLYRFLEKLGYEMSDEERQLQDGSHPIFKNPGKKDQS